MSSDIGELKKLTGLQEEALDFIANHQELHEMIWERGRRAAYTNILHECCSALGYADTKEKAWISERERTVAALRQVCEDHGDNDWDEKLHLADVVEKHLGRHLESK